MPASSRLFILFLLLSWVAYGCQGEPQGTPAPLTYHGQIKLLLGRHCVTCHKAGGLAPFPMESYEAFAKIKTAALHALKAQTMPPWPADAQCREIKHDLTLPKQDRDTLIRWLSQGAPKGIATSHQENPPQKELPHVDHTITLPHYQPQKQPDDYRCFLIPWQRQKGSYLRGFQIAPGNPAITHHMAMFLARPKDDKARKEYEELDASSPGPGYTCFGGPGGRSTLLASWAPGTRIQQYPQGTGLYIPKDAIIIVQMHYSTAFSAAAAKPTTIQLMLADQVDHPATFTGFTNPTWYHQPMSMKIPAGRASVTHTYQAPFAGGVGKQVTLYGVLPHLHLRGRRIKLTLIRQGGTKTCVNDVPRWDFNWQFMYFLKQPLRLQPGDQLRLECTWDNSASNQPLLQGKQATPKDLGWGEGTDEEMCVVSLYATCTRPDGTQTLCLAEE